MSINSRVNYKTDLFLFFGLFVLFYLSNARSSGYGWIAFALIVFFALFSNAVDCINLIFFLVPCIRILDSLGQTFYVNIAIALLGIKVMYVLFLKRKIHFLKPMLSTVTIFFVEFFHLVLNDLPLVTGIINSFNIAFDFLLCISIILYHTSGISNKNISYSLLIGVSVSSTVCLLVNPSILSSVLHSYHRFDAYGNDPNYLSMFIVLGIAGILTYYFVSQTKKYDFIIIIISCFWGLMTSSKMFVLCVLFLLILFTLYLIKRGKFRALKTIVLVTAFLLIVVAVFQKDNINYLINKVMARIYTANTMHAITTGRSDLLIDYLHVLSSDFVALFCGRGLSYARYYSNNGITKFVAHNTYLDLILSWGLIGGTVSILAFIFGVREHYCFQKSFSYYFPLLLFCIMIFALSCFSADMFWCLMAYCFVVSGTEIKKEKPVLKNESVNNCRNLLS